MGGVGQLFNAFAKSVLGAWILQGMVVSYRFLAIVPP